MSGSTLGTLFCVTSFGESHGPAIGCVVDGCPPGLALTEADIQAELDRRKPGTSRHVTQRRERTRSKSSPACSKAKPRVRPIGLLIRNTDQRSKDYGKIKELFRPGHADYTYWQKYGIRDYRGGGRQSARETAVRVAPARSPRSGCARNTALSSALYGAAGSCRHSVPDLDAVGKNPFFAPNAGSSPNSRFSWTGCASRAIRSAPKSLRSPRACRWGWASRCTTSSMPTLPTT